jgi:hypothetical protein
MMLIWWFFHQQVVAADVIHPVHRGSALVDLTDLVGDAGVEQDALGGGGLTGVDVRHDADVADNLEVRGDVDSHLCQRSLESLG